MFTSLLIFGFLLLTVNSSPINYETVVLEEWEQFKLEHGKTYDDHETELFRLRVFMDNKHKIAQHNQLAELGMKSYRLKMNHFGDLLHHEFVQLMNGYKRNQQRLNGTTYLSPNNVVIPKSVDWRKKGYVTPVKNQEQCGSCWAFSATGSLEGQHFRKTGKLVSLSEQQLVDCSKDYGNMGCSGGLMDNAFKYIKDNKGIDTEESYPYEGQDDTCRFNPATVGATDNGFVDIPSGDEEKLAEAVATVGPVSVAIDAGHLSFQFYSNGVYNEPDCSSTQLDHGVLAVGYGENENGEKYWIVKNSWGEVWGMKGYIQMSRGKDNQCGIATSASYPTV